MRKTVYLLACLCFTACNETARTPEQQSPVSQTTNQDTIAVAAATPVLATCQSRAPLFEPPVQQNLEPALRLYLKELQQAVKEQEAEALLNLLDPKIEIGFDGTGGIEDFRKKWNPENKTSDIWLLLNQLLQLGGTHFKEDKTNTSYGLPYVYSAWPDTLDAFTFSAVINEGALLRQEPDINAAPVCTLPRVILRIDYAKSYPQQANVPQKEWWYAESPDGQLKGYLHKTDLYSPVGYRALFNKNKKGKWLMTALVAGD